MCARGQRFESARSSQGVPVPKAAAYFVFDNCARIGYCDGGSLPALVSPPVDAGVDAADSAVPDTSTADAADAADTSIDDAADSG